MNAVDALAFLRSLPVYRFEAAIIIDQSSAAFAQYDGFKDGVAQLRFQSEDAANPHQVVHEYGHALRERYIGSDKFAMPAEWKALAEEALWFVPTVAQWGVGSSPYDEAFAQCVGWLYANHVPVDSGLRPGMAPIVKAYIEKLIAQKETQLNLPSPNFTAGRTRPIQYIVLHTTQGTDSRGWLTNPASQVSAHYLEREEDEYLLVNENDTAYHAGRIVAINTPTGRPTTPIYTGQFLGFDTNGKERWSVNPNDESVGIEMEGFAAGPVSPVVVARTTKRIKLIRASRGAGLVLVNHAQLSPGDRSDPGVWRAAVDAALEEDDVFSEADKAWIEQMVEGKVLAIERRMTVAIKDYKPQTHMSRRIIRSLKGVLRDPGTAYPDDESPIT